MQQLLTAELEELYLDPRNPRLGLRSATEEASPDTILDMMRSWSLEEIATSFCESGFWIQEALLCVKEHLYGAERLVVVEGNRRLAALKLLRRTLDGKSPGSNWSKLVEDTPPAPGLFSAIPYLLMPNRASVDIYLGYRHVTGIKEWAPAEKAEYISFLIDNRGLSYKEVMRKIGSKTDAVRRNYIAYRIYHQTRQIDDIDEDRIVAKFSVLFLALRTAGVQSFLGVDINAEPRSANTPVPADHVDNLREFVRWLFGSDESDPVVKDSRQIERFSRVLQSTEAVAYLRTSKRPSLDYAYVIAGGEEQELIDLIERAAFDVEQALSTLHLYMESERIRTGARRLILGLRRIEALFPTAAKPSAVV